MKVEFPGESADYRVARERLLQQEAELRRATEAVAELGGDWDEQLSYDGCCS